jgi:hypothetical protein
MKSQSDITSFIDHFAKHSRPITLGDLRDYYKQINPKVSDSTINWKAHDLVNSSILKRTGRGLFDLGKELIYHPPLSEKVMSISSYIKKRFPLIEFCVWDSSIINEFAQHISGYPFILIDVERDVAESVYFQLKEAYKPVFWGLSPAQVNNLLPDFEYPLLVRNLVSESPLQHNQDIPMISLEKLLVDIFSDPEFGFLEGSELGAIYRNAFYKYTVNENKLARYAARKAKKAAITNFIARTKENI